MPDRTRGTRSAAKEPTLPAIQTSVQHGGMGQRPMTEPDSNVRSGPGTLWLVSTPIGNLADLPPRAVDVLRDADLLLAEDTRHTQQLLNACGVGAHRARSGRSTSTMSASGSTA
jgi:hypothetical protein